MWLFWFAADFIRAFIHHGRQRNVYTVRHRDVQQDGPPRWLGAVLLYALVVIVLLAVTF